MIPFLGFMNAFHVVNAIGIFTTALSCVPVLELQPLVFLTYTGYRAALYSVVAAFLASTFGIEQLGALFGALYLVAAATNLLQFPLVAWSQADLGGSYLWPNIIYILMCIPGACILEFVKKAQEKRYQSNLNVQAQTTAAERAVDTTV
jgi:hypothetical protein